MKKILCRLKRSVWVFSLLGVTITLSAQQPQLTNTNSLQKSGHQIYKESKLYDSNNSVRTPVGDDAVERMKYEFERLKNPYLNRIPNGIRDAEVKFSSKISSGDHSKQSLKSVAKSANAKRFSNWQNRGPWNVGGRTRALAMDRTNENIILAGGVSGGLWRSTDAGATWTKVTSRTQSPSITCIVQDPRPGKERIWYYGSGEDIGNSARAGGAFFSGTGIYKSVNGGRTWRLLQSTSDGDVEALSPFDIINSIDINPVNGDVYVGTYNGVYRSQDGGNSFQEVLAGGEDNTTEVEITSTGIIYATIASEGDPNAGFFTSTDGNNWTNITPDFLTPTLSRTVMGVDPSNENIVYFFSRNLDTASEAFLVKYDADAETSEEMYTNLSANLPSNLGNVGNLNLQTGYNMIVKVSPADSNLVFVGGTNIYRSTDGFTTPAGFESWIAGYQPGNVFRLYTNQHPDQHELLFYPSNPNKVLSGNDGGVFVTEDVTATNPGAEPVEWRSLNNGYVTTQPYHVSFDPDANSDDLVAGFQDNGTWFTNSTDQTTSWTEDFGGDGSYNAIADGGRTRYVSSQRGRVFRLNFDESGNEISFTRVQPAGASGFGFVAPYILDPNNDNIMYMPAGNRMWRNNNLDEIPLFSNAATTVNWVGLANSDTPAGTRITSLDVSEYPEANRLYYGTNQGGIYRMDNANIDNQEVINIAEGKGLPAGFVNDINVDPSDSDRVIVTFSNYGILSLFLTENGGDTWTNISGNLEENPDGSGNGPSVRSTAFFGGSQGFFGSRLQRVYAATSTGLYYATRLNGERTRWIKESLTIGNAVTDEVKTRKDGFVALAAHGNGLFSARFPVFNELPESSLSVAYLLDDITVALNSGVNELDIDVTDLFVETNGNPIQIEFTNSNPDIATATLNGNTISLSINTDQEGQATLGLIATSGGEQVAEGFTVFVKELPIYEQNDPSVTGINSQFFTDFNALVQMADDFVVPEGDTWNINRILAFGSQNNTVGLLDATAIIYEDNNGVPGEEVYNSGSLVPSAEDGSSINLSLPEIITLESGTYWLSVYATVPFSTSRWFWSSQVGGIGADSQFRDETNFFGINALDWTAIAPFVGRPTLDQIFQVFGDVEDGGSITEEGVEEPLVELNTSIDPLAFPNPSSGTFNFNLNKLESKSNGNVSLRIYDITGTLVHQETVLNSTNTIWNASNRSPGVYFVEITGSNLNEKFKIVKK